MKKILFICSANKWRSPTAEHIFADLPEIETDSAGLDNSAAIPLSVEQLMWADLIFVMEHVHKRKLSRKFKKHLNGQRVIVLGIPDEYKYMDPELIKKLQSKVTPFLK